MWLRNCKFSQSPTGYLPSAVNWLTNTSIISNFQKGDVFEVILVRSDQKIWSKYSLADFTIVCHPLTCWISKEVLKRRFLESGLTKSLTVFNFRNSIAMTIIFYWKMFKIWWWFHKWNKKMRKSYLFLREFHLNRELYISRLPKGIVLFASHCLKNHA